MDTNTTNTAPIIATGFDFERKANGAVILKVISDPTYDLAATGRSYETAASIELTEIGVLDLIRNLALEISGDGVLLSSVAEHVGTIIDEADILPWQP